VIDRAQLGGAVVGPPVLCREIGWLFSHIRNVTTQAICVGALTLSLWAFEEPVTP
jgi:NADH:ubiquinone oxidoreductase subunit D